MLPSLANKRIHKQTTVLSVGKGGSRVGERGGQSRGAACAEGVGFGEGLSLSPTWDGFGEGLCPLPEFFF